MISFVVPAVPVAQPRARASFRNGVGRVYTDSKSPVHAFKATVRQAFREKYSGAPLEGPVGISVVFVLPRPKRLIWKKRPMPRVRHTSKPDIDNLKKAVMDALKGLAWRDDCQVCVSRCAKSIASGDEQPSVYVEIGELGSLT